MQESVFPFKKFIGTQPVTFESKKYNPKTKYFLTPKLDGVRRLLVIDNDKSYSISSKLEILPVLIKQKNVKYTILDCEFYNKKYYAFDILFYLGKDIRDETFKTRYKKLLKLREMISGENLKLKPYLSPYKDSICNNFKLLDDNKKYKKIMDGIIFTPDTNYYITPLKWKPIELLTIDFTVKKQSNNIIYLLLQDLSLYVNKDIPGIGVVKVSKKWYDFIEDYDVVEFKYSNGKFKPTRKRPDKVMSNHNRVINSNMRTILNPPNMDELLCKK